MIHKYKIESPDTILTDLIQKTKTASRNTLTKFSKNSVARGLLYAISSVISYVKGYINLTESQKFLSTCTGADLDVYAKEYYGLTRKGASKSSAEVYVHAVTGTEYPSGTQFVSKSGVVFVSTQSVTVGEGLTFAFIPVESVDYGVFTKVYAGTITQCLTPPSGHLACTNFIPAIGGYDAESDDDFKTRLYAVPNNLAQETPAKIENIVYQLFPEVGKCICTATSYGFANVGVLKTSGATLSNEDKDTIKANIQAYLGYTNSINLKVTDLTKIFIDLEATIKIKASADFEDVYEQIQETLLAYFEPRFYKGSFVRGEVVLSELVKIDDIIDIDQSNFSLARDIKTPESTIPWLRTINLHLFKETGETYDVKQIIPEVIFSSFNPHVPVYQDVL